MSAEDGVHTVGGGCWCGADVEPDPFDPDGTQVVHHGLCVRMVDAAGETVWEE